MENCPAGGSFWLRSRNEMTKCDRDHFNIVTRCGVVKGRARESGGEVGSGGDKFNDDLRFTTALA